MSAAADTPDDDAELEALATRLRTCLGAAHDDAAPASADPALADYAELREIQRGGQGVVYEARQLSTGRRVAIKRLHARGVGAERQRARFEREIELAARLVHPNVVPMFDRGVTQDGDLFFVMEFIDGLPLDRWADASELSVRERVALFDRLCAALAYAHRCGVVHRDLKPENVLVDDSGEPRLLDLGLAKPLARTDALDVTRAGEFLGTLAHASPEQFGDDPERVDERTDVHGLGVLLYRLLAGRHPFPTDGSLAELVRAVAERDPPPPTRGTAAPDADLDALCLTCLAKHPAQRYASVEALRADLAAWRDGRALQARAHHRGYVLRRALRRHRALVLAVLLVIAGLAASSVTAWSALGDAQREARRAEHLSDFLVDALVAAEPGLHPSDVTLVQWIERARLDVGARFRGEPISEAAVRDAVGHVLRAAGAFHSAEDEFGAALELLDASGAGAGRQAVATRLHRAQAAYERGAWDLAEERLAEVQRALAELAPDDRLALNDRAVQLASLLALARGRALDAVVLLDDASAAARAAGRDDAEALLLPVLADALRAAGELERSLDVHARAEQLRAARFGASHPFVQRVRNNRALVLVQLGRVDEALPVMQDTVAQLTRDLGAAHPATLQARLNLAGALEDVDRDEEARAAFEAIVDDGLEQLGPRHRTTLDAQHALGTLLRRADEIDAAEALLRAAHEGRARLLGARDERTLQSQVELALCVGRGGALADAEALLRDAVDATHDALGPGDATTLVSEHALAVLLLDTGRGEEAVALWAELLARVDALGTVPPERAGNYRLQHGLALARLGRLDDAVDALERAHAELESAGASGAASAEACAALLVQVHGARGDAAAVQRWSARP